MCMEYQHWIDNNYQLYQSNHNIHKKCLYRLKRVAKIIREILTSHKWELHQMVRLSFERKVHLRASIALKMKQHSRPTSALANSVLLQMRREPMKYHPFKHKLDLWKEYLKMNNFKEHSSSFFKIWKERISTMQ